ncbi:Transcription factor HHO3 [Hirschfeldia incana]|nr:Transcription factor HHO3 [Hirschfeldia incana]
MAKKDDNTLKMKRCQEYIEALEEELKKIQVFKRELPMCLSLVTQAIESYRKELSEFSRSEHIQSESSSEQTTSECEVRDGRTALFEEFMPIKSDEHESCERIKDDEAENNVDKKRSEWLQLWNQSPDPLPKEDQTMVVVQPFEKGKFLVSTDSQPPKAITPTPTIASSTAETGGNKKETDQQKQLQMHRKQRRCWSPELHRRFLRALQQLGGSHVATPKQIRDLMQVDGLTNDEVKSHLQKYRLHTRRPATPTSLTNGGENPQQPQLMVMEGIWVPSRDAVNNRVYAPVAAPPPRSSPSEPKSIQRCKPPTASSSTHPTHLLPLS